MVIKHWIRLTRAGCRLSILRDIQNLTGHSSEQPAGKKEDPGNYRSLSLTLIAGDVMEQLILETIARHM
ncbi:hypothetical protein QYF61_019924 [Mycteria americana]|uniref:Uncharacterized protein n=1 Tax=Mycteria americana TaxID=33587 RepID=A0AAN7MV46_MYCAM|nr:hypothetical protein QYF61_019924 [Mycteria americana]